MVWDWLRVDFYLDRVGLAQHERSEVNAVDDSGLVLDSLLDHQFFEFGHRAPDFFVADFDVNRLVQDVLLTKQPLGLFSMDHEVDFIFLGIPLDHARNLIARNQMLQSVQFVS